MEDRVKQIRAEVENWYNENLRRAKISGDDYWNAKADAYRNVLTSIDEMGEERCTETEFREIEILRSKLSEIAKAIYEHEGSENPTIERIRVIVQDCCFEQMDLQENPKPKFKIGDTIREKNNPQHIITIARITKCNYIGNDEDGVSFYSQDDWELVEELVSEDKFLSNEEPDKTRQVSNINKKNIARRTDYGKLYRKTTERTAVPFFDDG